MVKFSVVICTYDRCESLRDTLESLLNQRLSPELALEIIVVDNNSTDRTREVVEELISRSPQRPVRYLFEPVQGKSHALNRGINSAEGDFIAFSDDDIIMDPNWIQELHQAFVLYGADCVGGPVQPLWSQKPPKWLEDPTRQFGMLALLDRGGQPLIAGEKDLLEGNFLFGSNLAVRRSIFSEIGLFRTDLGPAGKEHYGGEDSEMVRRLLTAKKRVVYVPTVVVKHKIPPQRMTMAYLRKWNYLMARSNARLSVFQNVTSRVLLLDCAKSAAAALLYYLMSKQVKAVGAEINLWWRLGMLVELLSRGHCEDSPRSLAEPKQYLASEIASLPPGLSARRAGGTSVARNDKKGQSCQS